MSILVGTVEIGGVLPVFASGFRRLGHRVTTVNSCRNPFYPELEYDVDIPADVVRWPDAIAHSGSLMVRSPRAAIDRLFRLTRLIWLIAQHDVFLFQWAGTSLWPGNREYPLLKRLGKHIVSAFNGDDVRHWSAFDQQNALLKNSSVSLKHLAESYRNDPLARPLRNLRMAEKFSDLIISIPSQSGLAVRPYMHFFYPLDLSKYQCIVPDRNVPIIVHAPSDKSVKGTDIILPILERLRSEGILFELRLLHGVPNRQVLAELRGADVAIDQLHVPPYGVFGGEAMASGCALVTCNREELQPIPPSRPIWHIDPENLYPQLKLLLTNRGLRVRLAREGRQYVERYHDHVRITRQIVRCLKADNIERYDFYPTFFARHYRLPSGEVIPDDLKRMTRQVVERWGLPENVDLQDMIARGLISGDGLDKSNSVPRWKLDRASAEQVVV